MVKKGKQINIGKHDDNFNFFEKSKTLCKRMRIGSLSPYKLQWVNYTVISANRKYIYFRDKYFNHSDFFQIALNENIEKIIVLTHREYDFIIKKSIQFGVKINIFEELFPFFPNVRYVSDLRKNTNEARKRLNECKTLSINGGGARKWFSNLLRYQQERKIRYKRELDSIIYFSCIPPFQEVFKAKESANDRVIYALDFNSMYTDCLSGTFPCPKNLKYSKFDSTEYSKLNLEDGFYRAKLIQAKNTFFLKSHPFRYCTSNTSVHFNLEEDDSLEVYLPLDEIDYYSKFFNNVEIIEGIHSSQEIKHPLFDVAKTLFLERKSNPKSSTRSIIAKFKANIISSLGNPKRYKIYYFKSKEDLIKKFEEIFYVKFDNKLNIEQKIDLAKKGERIVFEDKRNKKGEYRVKIFNIFNNDSIYTFYSKIISNSRIKMVKLIEKLSVVETLEICYANVDSLHISLNKSHVDKFFELLSEDISDKIGGLKIEAVASSGYWFELGRYWLLDGPEIVKFSNCLFRSEFSSDPIVTERVVKKVVSLFGYKYVKSFKIDILNSFSFKKQIQESECIDDLHYIRYDFDDVSTASVASTNFIKEKFKSYALKCSLLDELVTVKCSTNIHTKL